MNIASWHERDNLTLMEMVWDGVGALRAEKKDKRQERRKNRPEDLALGMWWKTNGVTQWVHYELGRSAGWGMGGKDEALRRCE